MNSEKTAFGKEEESIVNVSQEKCTSLCSLRENMNEKEITEYEMVDEGRRKERRRNKLLPTVNTFGCV